MLGLWYGIGEDDYQTGRPEQYQASWTDFISQIRTLVGNPNFPIFYGTISINVGPPIYNTVVRDAQLNTAAGDANLYCRDNDDLTLGSDGVHFDATSQITFGQWVRQTYLDNY